MSFREGLLKARGQIAFIMALAVSTGIIIYLEALDTEERIQRRVATEMSRQTRMTAAVPPALERGIAEALRLSEEAYTTDPAALPNMAALLTSISSAVQAGLMKPEEGLAKAESVLNNLERQPSERSATISAALGAAAIAFPALEQRIASLSSNR